MWSAATATAHGGERRWRAAIVGGTGLSCCAADLVSKVEKQVLRSLPLPSEKATFLCFKLESMGASSRSGLRPPPPAFGKQ